MRLQTVISKMQQRKPEQNIAYMKNLLGTIKVIGAPTKLKVNVNELLGTRQLTKQKIWSKHDEFVLLKEYVNKYHNKISCNQFSINSNYDSSNNQVLNVLDV